MELRCVSKLFIDCQIFKLAAQPVPLALSLVELTVDEIVSTLPLPDSVCQDGVCSLSDWKPRANAS
jgi:hypothetical protein